MEGMMMPPPTNDGICNAITVPVVGCGAAIAFPADNTMLA